MKANEYQCEHCGGVFEKGWSDEECREESETLWTKKDLEHSALICDDCFNDMLETTVSSHMI